MMAFRFRFPGTTGNFAVCCACSCGNRPHERQFLAIETTLMHLSVAISSAYLGRNEPVEAREDLPS
jgi:hypothetical protein